MFIGVKCQNTLNGAIHILLVLWNVKNDSILQCKEGDSNEGINLVYFTTQMLFIRIWKMQYTNTAFYPICKYFAKNFKLHSKRFQNFRYYPTFQNIRISNFKCRIFSMLEKKTHKKNQQLSSAIFGKIMKKCQTTPK